MKMFNFLRHINEDPINRSTIYNCISLELSKSELDPIIIPPLVVRRLCWVSNCWSKCESTPEVSKYCLMSMKDSYTDFHIDFGGTSVWYHILKGEKLFYLIKPTEDNLKKYEEWAKLDNQNEVFLPDTLEDKCYSITLREGQTFFIPTGWIHAVYTPKDSIVFGGNFLHSINIPLQLKIYHIERRTKTPEKISVPVL